MATTTTRSVYSNPGGVSQGPRPLSGYIINTGDAQRAQSAQQASQQMQADRRTREMAAAQNAQQDAQFQSTMAQRQREAQLNNAQAMETLRSQAAMNAANNATTAMGLNQKNARWSTGFSALQGLLGNVTGGGFGTGGGGGTYATAQYPGYGSSGGGTTTGVAGIDALSNLRAKSQGYTDQINKLKADLGKIPRLGVTAEGQLGRETPNLPTRYYHLPTAEVNRMIAENRQKMTALNPYSQDASDLAKNIAEMEKTVGMHNTRAAFAAPVVQNYWDQIRGLEQERSMLQKEIDRQAQAIQNPAAATAGGAVGGAPPGYGMFGPNIDASPVYSDQNIQQAINAQRAANDQGLGSLQRRIGSEFAARGASSRSPLAQALLNNAFSQNMAANTGAEQNLRFTSAQANSDKILKAQQAREVQFSNRQQEDIARRNQQTGLISSLAGQLMSGV